LPYEYRVSNGAGTCTLDLALTASYLPLDRFITYSSAASVVQMVVRQACQSTVKTPREDGERFWVSVPPDTDGIWRKGIFVR
jgi:hypothetical protein